MAVYKDSKTGKWYAHGKFRNIYGEIEWYKKRGFTKKSEAKDWERKRLLEGSTSNMTLHVLANLYFDENKKSTKASSYQSQLYKYNILIDPYLGENKLSQITMSTINKWQNKILAATYDKSNEKKYYSNNYLEVIQSLLKSILKYGINNELLNDAKLITFKNKYHANEKKKEISFWEPEEYKKFIDVIISQEDRAFFSMLYLCGLRLGEISGLTWNDIDFNESSLSINKQYNNHTLSITTPKTLNSYRVVLIPQGCLNELKQHYDNCILLEGFDKNKYIFGFDKPLDDNTIRRKKDHYIDLAKVTKIRIHDFRHSHVSLLINQGFSAFDIAKRLGHTPEMVNKVYAHWFDNSQKKMVNKLNKLNL